MSYFCISWFSLFKYRDASLQLPGLLQPFVLLHLFPLQIWLLLLYGQLGLLLLSLKLSGRFISYNCLFYVSLFFFLSFFFGHTHYCCKKIFIWASEVSRLEKKGCFRMKMCVDLSVLISITSQVVTYVVTRPGRELLFTVVSQDEKYKAKVWILFTRFFFFLFSRVIVSILFTKRTDMNAAWIHQIYHTQKNFLNYISFELRCYSHMRGTWISLRARTLVVSYFDAQT